MNQSIIIPVHSVVDLITNSSSELFIFATDKTVDTATQLINELLKLSGSTKKAKDLFKIELLYGVKCEETGYQWKYFSSRKELSAWRKENDLGEYEEYYVDGHFLSIEAKDVNDETSKKVAELFTKLVGSLVAEKVSS